MCKQTEKIKAESMTAAKKLVLLFAFAAFLFSCQQDVPKERILLDFESDAELNQLNWKCHVLYSLSNKHATHGSSSLKLELFPSDWPGMEFMPIIKNWSDYTELDFHVYNASDKAARIGVRIDDRKSHPDYYDRYNSSYLLKRGGNHIVIPFESLVTSGSNRHLNLAQIHRIYIFMRHPETKKILYIDTVKLMK